MTDIRRQAAEEARRRVQLRDRAAAERRAEVAAASAKVAATPGGIADLTTYDSTGDGAAGWAEGDDGLPTVEECELGVERMISGTLFGMREGLELLGLPNDSLYYVKGKCLVLCGHDVRSAVNDLIHEWKTENREEFFRLLLRLQETAWHHWETTLRAGGGEVSLEGEAEEEEKSMHGSEVEEMEDEALPGGCPAEPSASSGWLGEEPSSPPPEAALAELAPDLDEDLYALLGVGPDATEAAVRARFQALVLSEHPSQGGDPDRFRKLHVAYAVLCNREKRREHDLRRRGGPRA